MAASTLQTFIDGVRSAWGPLTSELAAECRRHAERLLAAEPSEPWLAKLHAEALPSAELYRDPVHGFVLLAHTETDGLFRPPHDHGRAWVIYAVQSGASEMRTYDRVKEPDGQVRLVQRDTTLVKVGGVQIYLPGDIHDTRCVTGSALLFRFTERDLQVEDRQEHRVMRYVDGGGVWREP